MSSKNGSRKRLAQRAAGSGLSCLSFEVEGAFLLEEGQVAKDIGFNFVGVGFGVKLLEFRDDPLYGALTVAALDDFQTGAIEAERALRHEKDTLTLIFAEADAGSETRLVGEFDAQESALIPPRGAGKSSLRARLQD